MNVPSPNVSQLLVMNASANASVNKSILNASTPNGMQEDVVQVDAAFFIHAVFVMAIVANALLYVAPVNMAVRARKENVDMKTLGSWLAPTYLIFAQSYLWACYGYIVGLDDLAHFNAFGAFMCMSCMVMIARCVQPRDVAQPVILMSICVILAFSFMVYVTCPTIYVRSCVFGYSATLFNLGQIYAPLPDAFRVIRTGHLAEFPLALTVGTFLSSLLWTEYCFLVHDHLYLVPNLIGAIVCGGELLAIYWSIWGESALGSAQQLLGEADNQPLMPRVRGKKTSMSNCRELLQMFNGGGKSQHPAEDASLYKDREFGLDDQQRIPMAKNGFQTYGSNFMSKSPFGAFSAGSVPKVPERFRSPFGALDHGEGQDSFTEEEVSPDFECQFLEEPDFECQFVDAQDEYSPVSIRSEVGLGFASANGAVDCIL